MDWHPIDDVVMGGVSQSAMQPYSRGVACFGGVVSLGCTVGQGITGFSTLALGSIVTFLAIVAGAAATMKYEYWKLMREG